VQVDPVLGYDEIMKNVNTARRWHTGEVATPNRTVSGVQRKTVAETPPSPTPTWANHRTDAEGQIISDDLLCAAHFSLLWAPESAATPLQRVAVWSVLVAFSVCFWYLAGEIVVAVVAR
jgi:hypothetical protein